MDTDKKNNVFKYIDSTINPESEKEDGQKSLKPNDYKKKQTSNKQDDKDSKDIKDLK